MNVGWLSLLLAHSGALCLLGLLSWLTRPWWRHGNAVTGYRFTSLLIGAALLLPLLQLPVYLFQELNLRTQPYEGQIVEEVITLGPRQSLPTLHAPQYLPSERSIDLWLVVVAVYLCGVVVVVGFHVRSWRQTHRLLSLCRPTQDSVTLALWRQVTANALYSQRVRILTCPGLCVPCCGGVLSPFLLVPELGADLDRNTLAWALRHEWVHLQRRDARLAAMQAVFLTLFWFHPVAWWLGSQFDWWREVSCDTLVVERTGGCKRYAMALLEFASRVGQPARQAALLHWLPAKYHLRSRLEYLAERAPDRADSRQRGRFLAAVAGLLVIGGAELVGTRYCEGASVKSTEKPQGELRKLVIRLGNRAASEVARKPAQYRFRQTRGTHQLEIESHGDVAIDANAGSVGLNGQDGFFRLNDRDGAHCRSVQVQANGQGILETLYSVDGQRQGFDESGHKWLTDRLRDLSISSMRGKTRSVTIDSIP